MVRSVGGVGVWCGEAYALALRIRALVAAGAVVAKTGRGNDEGGEEGGEGGKTQKGGWRVVYMECYRGIVGRKSVNGCKLA